MNKNARLPYKEEGNAGYDLFSVENVIIPPLQRRLIKTGISIALPKQHYGHISDRSGMAFKNGGHCLGKIVDESFRGEIGIILYNTDSKTSIEVKIGDRPAQMIIQKYEDVNFVQVDELDQSIRMEKGFGSSGV